MGSQAPEDDSVFTDQSQPRLYSSSKPPSLASFAALCSQTATLAQYPLASSIDQNVPVYHLEPFSSLTDEKKTALQDEWYRVLLYGPGVFVTKRMYRDTSLLDRVNGVFHNIIAKEKDTLGAHGDHFAGAGKNDRIWNSFSKHGLEDPASFLEYYSNPYLGLISSSWLGRGYRITAQVNNVKPGATAQVSHRDYHLGFMSVEDCSQVPRAMQVASQCLTLQGAVAHVDVPLESGPTRLLPFSQAFPEGYMAYRRTDFNDYFLENYVSLPLEQGDGLFFNPALFHAAGTNQSSDIHRLANLLQISSPFGKPMEAIDAIPLIDAVWDDLVLLNKKDGHSDRVQSFIAAVGEGYAFPTNLDHNPPRTDNMAPKSEQEVIWNCLVNSSTNNEVRKELNQYRAAIAS